MSIDRSELCARYRRLYLPAVADAIYRQGGVEHVLPSTLRPLFPDQRTRPMGEGAGDARPSSRRGRP